MGEYNQGGKYEMNSTWNLLKQTTPFIWMRLLIYMLFAVGSVIFLVILVGISALLLKWFGDSSGIVIVMVIVAIGVLFSFYRLLERYILYLLKAAHIAVLVELIDQGSVPDGKGQIEYGKERVKAMFGTASVFFAVDQLVASAVKQIHRWLMRLGNLFGAIPGAKVVINLASMVLGIALNYIDEAVLSRVMKHKKDNPESNVWQTSADGVVLYAQSWKGMIGAAAGVALFSIALSVASFLITLFPLLALVKLMYSDGNSFLGVLAFISALSISTAVKKAFVDPVATITMIRAYHTRTAGVEPSIDLRGKMLAISGKFKDLVNRAESNASEQATSPPLHVEATDTHLSQ